MSDETQLPLSPPDAAHSAIEAVADASVDDGAVFGRGVGSVISALAGGRPL